MTTSKTRTAPPVESLLPHEGALRLVDTLLDYDAERVQVGLTVRDAAPFGDGEGGVPAYLGIEYMAQAISVFSGLDLLAQGIAPKIGLLIGTRRFHTVAPRFAHGSALVVTAARITDDGKGMWVFDCTIADAQGAVIASAQVKAYRPEDIRQFLDAR